MEQIPYEDPSSGSSIIKHYVSLIWLDASVNTSQENVKLRKELELLNDEFKAFEKFEECRVFIRQNKTGYRIILIVSGRIGQQIIDEIHELSQLMTIFVYVEIKLKTRNGLKIIKK